MDDKLKEAAADFLREWAAEKDNTVRVAFFGQPGAGKSSLINALVGSDIAEVSNRTDTTKKAQVVTYRELIFVDLPGYDTSEFPANQYFTSFNPQQYDLFLCVFSGKLHQADTRFFRQVKALGRPCVFVRNKAEGIYDAGRTREESLADIREDVRRQVGEAEVVFTSCRKDLPYEERGIRELEEAIARVLGPAQRDKFVRAAKAYSQELLEQKRSECRSYINNAMVKGALNGLNPIWGADMALDAAILHQLYAHIRETYAIGDAEIRESKIAGELAALIKKGCSKEAIVEGLRSVMTKSMEKRLAKYIPYIGQGVAMSAGAGFMYYLGYEYVDLCHQYASVRLAGEIARMQADEDE